MPNRTVLDVLYNDGTEAALSVRPVGLMAAERKYGGGDNMPRVEATLFAAWHGIQGPKPPFDEWCESLEAIAERTEEPVPLVTAPEASPPASSDSPPEPE